MDHGRTADGPGRTMRPAARFPLVSRPAPCRVSRPSLRKQSKPPTRQAHGRTRPTHALSFRRSHPPCTAARYAAFRGRSPRFARGSLVTTRGHPSAPWYRNLPLVVGLVLMLLGLGNWLTGEIPHRRAAREQRFRNGRTGSGRRPRRSRSRACAWTSTTSSRAAVGLLAAAGFLLAAIGLARHLRPPNRRSEGVASPAAAPRRRGTPGGALTPRTPSTRPKVDSAPVLVRREARGSMDLAGAHAQPAAREPADAWRPLRGRSRSRKRARRRRRDGRASLRRSQASRSRQGQDDHLFTEAFFPVTNLCRDRCAYCTFRRDEARGRRLDDDARRATRLGRAARHLDCVEALLCLGDKPEAAFPGYRRFLASRGHRSTIEYVAEASRIAPSIAGSSRIRTRV